jgi:large subunit ribosomal protein L15
MPLQRRLPKFGFNNIHRVEYKPINISTLQNLAETRNLTVITPDILIECGMLSKGHLVKILAKGELKTKLDVQAHAFSDAAQKAIEEAGGTVTVI